MNTNNNQRITKTFSIPPDEVEEMEEILKFYRKHRVNYSALIRAHLKKYYDENKAIIQRLFYDNKGKSKSPT